MFKIWKTKVNENANNPVILPGYQVAPSQFPLTPTGHSHVLAAGPGNVTSYPNPEILFAAARAFGPVVQIRPYGEEVTV